MTHDIRDYSGRSGKSGKSGSTQLISSPLMKEHGTIAKKRPFISTISRRQSSVAMKKRSLNSAIQDYNKTRKNSSPKDFTEPLSLFRKWIQTLPKEKEKKHNS